MITYIFGQFVSIFLLSILCISKGQGRILDCEFYKQSSKLDCNNQFLYDIDIKVIGLHFQHVKDKVKVLDLSKTLYAIQ